MNGQQQFDLGTMFQPGQFKPAANANSFYRSEGGADPSSLRPYSTQDRYAIYQHYKKDMDRVNAGGAPNPELVSSYDALREAIPGQAKRAAKVARPEFYVDDTGTAGYTDAKDMTNDISKGSFRVSKTAPDQRSIAFPDDVNDDLRALHDTIAHAGAGSSFSYEGESLATEAHRSTLPQAAHRALTAEVLGQATHHEFGGGFVDQKGLYDVPDWAAKGQPRPIDAPRKIKPVGTQLRLF